MTWTRTDSEQDDINLAATSLYGRLPSFADIVPIERIAVHELCLAVFKERLHLFIGVEDRCRSQEKCRSCTLLCNETTSKWMMSRMVDTRHLLRSLRAA